MNAKRIGLWAASIAFLTAAVAAAQGDRRSAYSYVRESTGEVSVLSGLNGEVQARRNLPISAGDEVRTEESARAEIALADGNVLHVGGATRVKFSSLYAQQGSDDDVSAIDLSEGSVILSVVGSDDRAVPRVDTEDASVYTSAGSRVRVNADSRRGTSVVVRAGSVEVKSRAGSYTVRAGNYLLIQGDQEPEIARGNFSRDRFDLWASDRLEATYDSPRSTSSRYVDQDYSSDVQALDGYGDWDYSTAYSTNVWRPRVSIGWSPYSVGSWYYTPVGLTWWSGDPWGWYPFHYGNWFFDTGWNSWCWSPGYVYSPAWVYWGYSSSYVGWCPVGYYGGFYSPWWDNYYRSWGYARGSLAFAINGRFSTRQVDFRGWNFTGSSNLGVANGRQPIIAGTRVVDRLGTHLAVSSRPIVLANRGSGGVREGLQNYVREAPRVIERTGRDSERLAPVLARERTLPQSTVEALRERTVVAERGRVSGPGAADLAPRGATIIERGNGAGRGAIIQRSDTGRTVITDRNRSSDAFDRARPGTAPERPGRAEVIRPESRTAPQDTWRGRAVQPPDRRDSGTTIQRGRDASPGEMRRAPANDAGRQPAPGPADDWRGRPVRPAPSRESTAPRSESHRSDNGWRSRSEVPPARRVIEGAVPGRRLPDRGPAEAPRDYAPRERGYSAPPRDAAPPRDYAPRERNYSAPPRDYAPRDRGYSAPPRDAAPRDYAPTSIERAPAPPQRSSPPREAAPAPRSAPPRSAPPPSRSAPSSPSSRPPGRP